MGEKNIYSVAFWVMVQCFRRAGGQKASRGTNYLHFQSREI